MPTAGLYLLSIVCVGVMGFAIQYGATCTVAAVDEVVTARKFNRLSAMIEAALWVGCGVAVYHLIFGQLYMPRGYDVGGATIAGGVLLGLGAYINRACVFGAIAKLGSGDWAYLFTPLGYFLACVLTARFVPLPSPHPLAVTPLLLRLPAWAIVGAALILGYRVLRLTVAGFVKGRRHEHYRPHTATLFIGVTFLVLLLTSGAWTYMDILTDVARHGMVPNAVFRSVLFVMLIAGAMLGGWQTGRLKWAEISVVSIVRCLAGGFIMSLGCQLIPGQNDGLILIGMPLLWAYAWIAFATMCVTIAATKMIVARVG